MPKIELKSRPRRLRKNEIIRSLVQETYLHPAQFIAPIFIHEGNEPEIEIKSMPVIYEMAINRALKHVEELI